MLTLNEQLEAAVEEAVLGVGDAAASRTVPHRVDKTHARQHDARLAALAAEDLAAPPAVVAPLQEVELDAALAVGALRALEAAQTVYCRDWDLCIGVPAELPRGSCQILGNCRTIQIPENYI